MKTRRLEIVTEIIGILIIIGIVWATYTLFRVWEIQGEILRDHKEWLRSECSEMGEYYLLGEEELGEEELGEDVRRIDCIDGGGEIRVKYYIRGER